MSLLPDLRNALVKAAARQARAAGAPARVRRRGRPSAGALATALAALVTVAVVAVGLTLGGHGHTSTATRPAASRKHVALLCATPVVGEQVPVLSPAPRAVIVVTRFKPSVTTFVFPVARLGSTPRMTRALVLKNALVVKRALIPIQLPAAKAAALVGRFRKLSARCGVKLNQKVIAAVRLAKAGKLPNANLIAPVQTALIAAKAYAGKSLTKLCLDVSPSRKRCDPNAYVLAFAGDTANGIAPDGIARVELRYPTQTVAETFSHNTFKARLPHGASGVPKSVEWLTASGTVRRNVKLGS